MPRQGQVGGGHQNSWERVGDFYQKYPKPADEHQPVRFKKNNITSNTNRNESECWTAGTPIEWDDLIFDEKGLAKMEKNNPRAITADVQGIDMLVSRDAYSGKITEFHPLITFFNEVMARILTTDKELLHELDTEEKAMKLWRFIEKEFLTPPGKVKINGSVKKTVAKKRKPVKKSKPAKKSKAGKKRKPARKK